jgi:hypothetical protein
MVSRRVFSSGDSIRNIRSLELLSPHLLRKRSRAQDKDIGAGEKNCPAF